MLQRVLQDEMGRRHLSYRDAAKEIGTTHNTIMRILAGEQINLETLIKISEWSGIGISNLLGMQETEDDKAVQKLVSALVESEPGLKEVFVEAYRSFLDGDVNSGDFRDIAAYAAYRLSIKKRGRNLHDKQRIDEEDR